MSASNTPAAGPIAFFTTDHHECDEAWVAFEQAASSGDAAAARDAWPRFRERMLRHFSMEEEVLFPAIEEATGMRGTGPVAVMRQEHAQMRALLDQMAARAGTGDLQAVLDQGDTLLMVVQQHNAKEEGILYPMAERVLSSGWPAVSEALGRFLR